MQIVCPTCSKRLQIADDKLPADRQVRLTCPACQELFTFDPRGKETPTDSASATTPNASSLSTSASIDITDIGTAPRALICLDTPSNREAFQGILPSMGYKTIHAPSNQAQAMAHLSQVPYDCFILDTTFDGSSLEANPVLACLDELPMERRRYMFVGLCIPDTITADTMTAYSHSVSCVISHPDIATCRRLLEQKITEHKRLYKVYREMRQQLGKDI